MTNWNSYPALASAVAADTLLILDTTATPPAAGTVKQITVQNLLASGTPAASSPAFTSGVAQQLSTTQDAVLYIAIQVSAALAVAIGPTSATAVTVMPSQSYPLGLATVRVPRGWYVKVTGTVADLAITQVTC